MQPSGFYVRGFPDALPEKPQASAMESSPDSTSPCANSRAHYVQFNVRHELECDRHRVPHLASYAQSSADRVGPLEFELVVETARGGPCLA